MKTCTVESCGRPHSSRGLCRKHYNRWKRHGDPSFVLRHWEPGRTCSVEGCEGEHESRGYCAKHARRFRTHGNTDVVLQSGGWNKHQSDWEPSSCAADDCDKPAHSRGFCRSHYRRLRLYGDPLTPPRKVLRHQGTCSLATCERDARVRGLCRTHYTQNANRKRRAILFALGEHHTAEEWAAKLDEYGHKCAYCGTRAVERDHVVPLSKGGTDTIDNIVPACRSCNSMKSDRINWKGGVP